MHIEGLIEKYRLANNRVIFLDYDGTLIDYTPVPESSPLPSHLFSLLQKLLQAPRTDLFIITGRGFPDIDKIFHNLPVSIIAEHGAVIRENGRWINQLENNNLWKKEISGIMNVMTSLCPGSFIEEKSFSLAWHYRKAEVREGHLRSRELIEILGKAANHSMLKILDGNKVVEVMPDKIGKGNSVKKFLEKKDFDFILSIGDDTTDEEMFEYLLNNRNAFTFKVGNGVTFARYKLPGIDDVISLIEILN